MSKKNIIHLTVGQIATNCWIYPFGEKDAFVIDPGAEADKIISALKRSELFPSYILLTHGHFDHIAAVPALKKAFEGKPKIAIHRLDSEYLGEDAYSTHSVSVKAAMGSTSFIDAYWPDVKNGLPPPDMLLEEGETIGPLTVLRLPGHTPGSIAFWDKDESVIFTGDTLFRNAYGRTDLPGGCEEDIYESLKRLFTMDGNIEVYPGHEGITTIGREAARISI
jgi:glyoxylase-like metal-dependent hydrolase (beta-lactamase superfamily II)